MVASAVYVVDKAMVQQRIAEGRLMLARIVDRIGEVRATGETLTTLATIQEDLCEVVGYFRKVLSVWDGKRKGAA